MRRDPPPYGPRRRGPARAAALVLALGGAGACGGGGGGKGSELERQLAAQLTAQLGAQAEVRCEGAPPKRCMASLAGSHIPLALSDEAGQVRWRIQGLVVSAKELERQLVDELAALGLGDVTPRCGPALQIAMAGDRIACRLAEAGAAWATVNADGSYALELALGAAAVERSQDLDEAQLDELSRALDREQGDRDEGEDGEDPGDALGEAAPRAGSGVASGAAAPRGAP
jgi:hypothetical protein